MPTTLLTNPIIVRASTNHGTGDCTVPILLNTKSKEKLNAGHKNHTANRKIRHDNKGDQIKVKAHKLTEMNKSVL